MLFTSELVSAIVIKYCWLWLIIMFFIRAYCVLFLIFNYFSKCFTRCRYWISCWLAIIICDSSGLSLWLHLQWQMFCWIICEIVKLLLGSHNSFFSNIEIRAAGKLNTFHIAQNISLWNMNVLFMFYFSWQLFMLIIIILYLSDIYRMYRILYLSLSHP